MQSNRSRGKKASPEPIKIKAFFNPEFFQNEKPNSGSSIIIANSRPPLLSAAYILNRAWKKNYIYIYCQMSQTRPRARGLGGNSFLKIYINL